MEIPTLVRSFSSSTSPPRVPELTCSATSITAAGQSEYRLNGVVATYKKYNAQLEAFNILVKAKNFLVFQGDVEAVAAQSPKDLARLIDQISGSLDLKDVYDKAATALEKATEMSVQQHGRRKGVNGEIKQYKEMKKEAERWATLEQEKVRSLSIPPTVIVFCVITFAWKLPGRCR